MRATAEPLQFSPQTRWINYDSGLLQTSSMSSSALVRYGRISEVARIVGDTSIVLHRGKRVVIRSRRGLEIGTLLEDAPIDVENIASSDKSDSSVEATPKPDSPFIVREATDDDERAATILASECEEQFHAWRERIGRWRLQLELIDLEWMLDKSKLILYVLNDRGAECTRLALQAATNGLGAIEVQSVTGDGPGNADRRSDTNGHGGSCGSGHCGSGTGCCG